MNIFKRMVLTIFAVLMSFQLKTIKDFCVRNFFTSYRSTKKAALIRVLAPTCRKYELGWQLVG